MTEEEFNNSYQYSPILRTRYEGFLRNIVVALGNSKDASVIPALQKLLNHSNPIFRLHAAWALGQFDSIDSRLSLENAQKIEIHPDVRAEIQAALSK
jgi:epoxyqueuosine reductase